MIQTTNPAASSPPEFLQKDVLSDIETRPRNHDYTDD